MSKYIGATVVNLSVDTVDVTGDITATDATPEVIIINDTHEDTDGGREGKVTFKGQQTGGEETTLAQIQASHDGTSDDEKGDLIFKTNDGSDGSSPTERMRIDSAGDVGIGTSSPTFATGGGVQLVNSGFASFRTTSGSSTGVDFAQFTDGVGYVYNRDNAGLIFGTNNANRMEIDSSGRVGIGGTPNTNWRDDISNQEVLMLGTEATLYSDGGVTTELWNNAYVDDSDVFKNISTRGASRYFQYSGAHKWFAAASASAGSTITSEIQTTPKLQLDTDGLKFNGDTAAANALDDYEEGEHEVTLTPSGSGSISVSGSNNDISYTKIGNRVHVSGQVLVSGSSSPVGYIKVSLPFPIKNSGTANTQRRVGGLVNIRYTSLNTNQYTLLGVENESFIRIYRADSTDILSTSANQFATVPGSTGISVLFNFTYPTDS